MKKLTLLITSLVILLAGLEVAQAAVIQTYPISHQTLPRNAVRVPFLEIHIATDHNPVRINTIIARKTGLSTSEDVDSVRIQGQNGQSFRGNVDNDDLVRLRFLRGYYIPANTTDELVLWANLDVQGHNRTVGFELVDIETDNGAIYGDHLKPQRNTYNYNYTPRSRSTSGRTTNRTSSYEIPSLEFEGLSNGGSILVGRNNRIGRFRIKNPSRKTINVNNLSLRNIGSARLEDMFDTLELKDNNGWTVARSSQIGGNYVTFNLNNYPLRAGNSAVLSVWGEARFGRFNRTIQLVLDDKEDLSGTFGRTGYPTAAQSRTQSGSRSFTRSSQNYISNYNSRSVSQRSRGLWNRNYNPGENQITFMAERMSFKAPVYLDRFRAVISPSSRITDHNGNGQQDLEDYETSFENFRLYINGEYIDQSRSIDQDGNRLYVEFSVGEAIGGSNEFRVVGDIGRSARTGDRLKLRIDRGFSFPEWEYIRY